jgi:class 3 adenylate cyclase
VADDVVRAVERRRVVTVLSADLVGSTTADCWGRSGDEALGVADRCRIVDA